MGISNEDGTSKKREPDENDSPIAKKKTAFDAESEDIKNEPPQVPNDSDASTSPEIISRKSNPFGLNKRCLNFPLSTNSTEISGDATTMTTPARMAPVFSSFKWTQFSSNFSATATGTEAHATSPKEVKLSPTFPTKRLSRSSLPLCSVRIRWSKNER